MATAYVVTTGEYSDYRVVAVFTTRESAEKYVGLWPDRYADCNDPRIEEYLLDEVPGLPPGKVLYRVLFDRDGNSVAKHEPPTEYMSGVRPYGDGKTMVTYCWARDSEHAVKIANERRVQTIAAGEWEADWRA
jgi:hypothetical protein